MAIPRYSDLFRTVLDALKDGATHHWNTCVQYTCEVKSLSEAERKQLHASGRGRVLDNRVHWAITYVKQAGLIESPKRGYVRLTDEGVRVQADDSILLDESFLDKYASFRAFKQRRKENATNGNLDSQIKTEQEDTPDVRMDDAFDEINRALESELLDEIMRKKDEKNFSFFEHLVVDLVKAMGYGSHLDNPGFVTPLSGDGGIDGIVAEDKLGFSKIYIQAKCWALDSTVGAPDIHKFMGALMSQGANKGLFITTGKFSAPARELVDKPHDKKIVLVDGSRLAKLMIEYGIGVSPTKLYVVKHIDSDYFAE